MQAEREEHDCRCTACGNCKHDHNGFNHDWTDVTLPTAEVTLFKPSGKYYTTEHWLIPTDEELETKQASVDRNFRVYSFQPACMKLSPDFRRISGGPVLVHTQEPWGFPQLFPGE